MPDRIQRNRATGEYRILTETGWRPYTPSATRPADPERLAHQPPSPSPTAAMLHHLISKEPATLGALGGGAALLAPLLGIGAGVASAAGALAPAAGHLVSRGYRGLTGQEQPTISPSEIIDVAGGPALQYGGKAIGAASQALAARPAVLKELLGLLGAAGGHTVSPGYGTLGGYFAARRFSPLAHHALESAGKTRPATATTADIGQHLKNVLFGPESVPPVYPLGVSSRFKPHAPHAVSTKQAAARASQEVPYRAPAAVPRSVDEVLTDLAPPVGPRPEMATRVTRATEANPRRTSLRDELQHEERANPELIRQRVTRAAGSEPPPDYLLEPPWKRTGFVEDPDLPTSWRTGIHNTVQEDIRRILETLRRRPTPGLTNPIGR